MSAITAKCAAWKTMRWLAARLQPPRRCPVPLSGVRGHLEALLHSPHGGAVIGALAAVAFVLFVRSGWRDIHGRWSLR